MTRREKRRFEAAMKVRTVALDYAIIHRKDNTRFPEHVVETAQWYESYLLTGKGKLEKRSERG